MSPPPSLLYLEKPLITHVLYSIGKRLWFEPPTPKSSMIPSKFLEAFRSYSFDRTLRHVTLDGKSLVNEPGIRKNSQTNRNAVVFVFNWLYNAGVREVYMVTVDDFQDPHNDEAIETALNRFRVEILNWRKLDLCSTTIERSSSELREVHLYWSGNNAVLRGWSEPEGLPRLRQLTDVHLYVNSKQVRISKNYGVQQRGPKS